VVQYSPPTALPSATRLFSTVPPPSPSHSTRNPSRERRSRRRSHSRRVLTQPPRTPFRLQAARRLQYRRPHEGPPHQFVVRKRLVLDRLDAHAVFLVREFVEPDRVRVRRERLGEVGGRIGDELGLVLAEHVDDRFHADGPRVAHHAVVRAAISSPTPRLSSTATSRSTSSTSASWPRVSSRRTRGSKTHHLEEQPEVGVVVVEREVGDHHPVSGFEGFRLAHQGPVEVEPAKPPGEVGLDAAVEVRLRDRSTPGTVTSPSERRMVRSRPRSSIVADSSHSADFATVRSSRANAVP